MDNDSDSTLGIASAAVVVGVLFKAKKNKQKGKIKK